MDFNGKVAIVTGGGQGVGRAYCCALLEKGVKVCVCDINDVAARKFISSLDDKLKANIIFQHCDVASYDELKAAFEKTLSAFQRIDIVVNNAAVINEREWRKLLDINLMGVIHGIHLAIEYMGKGKGGKGGHVVNTSSYNGFIGSGISPIYAASKHAVHGLTTSFGSDYQFARTGVKVNAIAPGAIDTQLFHNYPINCLDQELGAALIANYEPMKPEEIAGALIKVLSDGRNGAVLRIDAEGVRYENVPKAFP